MIILLGTQKMKRGTEINPSTAIPSPTDDQLTNAFNFASNCYPAIGGISGRVFLVPHAGIDESRICTASALIYAPRSEASKKDPGKILIVGTNHSRKRFGTDITIIDDPMNVDHSLYVPGAHLRFRNYQPLYALVNPETSPDSVSEWIRGWMNKDRSRMVVFSVDLSHYRKNQDLVIRAEAPLISGLLTGSPSDVDQSLNVEQPIVNTAGALELMVLSRLVKGLGLGGRGLITCYTDSSGKRTGWSTADSPKGHVSYAGIVWSGKVNPKTPMTPFERQFITSFARTSVIASVMGSKPPSFPSWSRWWSETSGVFVGVRSQQGGPVRASIGRYETKGNKKQSVVINVSNAAADISKDAAIRFKKPLGRDEIVSLHIYVNVLQPISQWVKYTPPANLIGEINADDDWGLYLVLPRGKAATYLPSVWKGKPSMSLRDLFENLSVKAGADRQSWKDHQSSVYLYKTDLVELCDI